MRRLLQNPDGGSGRATIVPTSEGCELLGLEESDMWRICTSSRLASGIRIRLGEAREATKFAVYNHHVRTLPWEAFLPLRPLMPTPTGLLGAVKISATCHGSKLFHSDALSERLRDYLERKRLILSSAQETRLLRHESVDGQKMAMEDPLSVYILMQGDKAQVSVDAGGDLLSRRGYRTHVSEAPIRENLAAACLDAMDYTGEKPLWDPFCGSGTLLCEALLRAANRNCVLRTGMPLAVNQLGKEPRSFGFQQWRSFPEQRYLQWAGENADAWTPFSHFLQEPSTGLYIGSDISRASLDAARHNWKALTRGRKEMKSWRGDFNEVAEQVLKGCPQPPILFSNLPYGVRLAQHLNSIYNRLNKMVKERQNDLDEVYVLDGSADDHFLAIASSHHVQWQSVLQFSNG